MLLSETDLARFDESAFNGMLAALPPTWQERVARKKPFTARLQSAVGYTLLRKILTEYYGIVNLPAIDTDEYGKPFFKDCDLFFSISHCQAAVVCVVEDHPVAVDVQDILHGKSDRFKARLGAPPDIDDVALTILWTQKEASAKLDGRGMRHSLLKLPLSHHTLTTVCHNTFIITTAI